MSMEPWYSKVLPFATAPAIVRANQKDTYFIKEFEEKINELVKSIKGSRFVLQHGADISTLTKFVYFLVTTGFGARTLGEEYVDLSYVDRSGYRRVGKLRRMGFVLAYVLLPYILSKLASLVGSSGGGEGGSEVRQNKLKKILSKLTFVNIVDAMNLHLALFYFTGKYYQLAKRVFGMRYVFRYNPDARSRQANGNYELLGGLMMIQLLVKYGGFFKSIADNFVKTENGVSKEGSENSRSIVRREIGSGIYKNMAKMTQEEEEGVEENYNKVGKISSSVKEDGSVDYNATLVDLSDPKQLPYLPEQSRICMLCLSPMKNPSCATCGHFFCWGCIMDWCQERQECPLCRSPIRPSQLLPLR